MEYINQSEKFVLMRELHIMENRSFFTVLRVLISSASIAGVVFFFVPIVKNYLILTDILLALFCIFPALLINIYPTVKRKRGRKGEMLLYIILVPFLILLIWFGFLTVKMNTVDYGEAPENAVVVVPGAKVYEDRVSKSFATRLDAACDYLLSRPESRCVVTGGQGADEPRTEAAAGAAYLEEKGISSDRISQEDNSVDTIGNFSGTKTILESEKLEPIIVISTQDYHQYRSRCIAEDMGYKVYSIKAYTDPLMYPSYYSRELLALTKYYIMKLF